MEEMREMERRKEREKKEKKGKGKEREKEKGGRRFLPQFIGIPTVGTRWTKEQSPKIRRGATLQEVNSSDYGLFLAFGPLFWADFRTVLRHVNGMGRVCSRFKGLLSEQIWVENLHL